MGPAQVSESSETHGYIDASYRSSYGGPETPKLHEELENYMENTYLAKTLTKFTHSDGADFEHSFHLMLVVDGARRGFTSIGESIVATFPTGAANGLPKWFYDAPPVVSKDTPDDTRRDLELAAKSRPATYAIRPFIVERRTRILIPDGFALRSLPADKTTQLGTATLTEKYSAAEPGVVTAAFRFDSGPSVLTAEQALALRSAMQELNKREYVGIRTKGRCCRDSGRSAVPSLARILRRRCGLPGLR
jgi:hypothetical protein